MDNETEHDTTGQEIVEPAIVVNAQNPLTLRYTDGNLAFFIDSHGQPWTFFETINEFRPSKEFDFHPMHHQDFQTGKMPIVNPELEVKFSHIVDAGIYVKRVFYATRLETLQSLIKEKQARLELNPNDAESREILNLAEESIPEIQEFIEAADKLQAAADDKAKTKLRTTCVSLIEQMEDPKRL